MNVWSMQPICNDDYKQLTQVVTEEAHTSSTLDNILVTNDEARNTTQQTNVSSAMQTEVLRSYLPIIISHLNSKMQSRVNYYY